MPLQHSTKSHLSSPFFFQRNPPLFWCWAHSPRASPGTTPVAVPWASAVHPDLRPPPRRADDLRPCAAWGSWGLVWQPLGGSDPFFSWNSYNLCAIREQKSSLLEEENTWQEYISARSQRLPIWSFGYLLFCFDVWKGEGFEWFESVGCLFKDGKKSWTFEPFPFNPLKGRIFQWLATQ